MTGSIGAHGLYTAIDLAGLPPPQIIAQPDFETIFAARKARLIEIAKEAGTVEYVNALTIALELESEPLVQLLQEDSYRELLLRAAIQDAGKGTLLAFARGAILDHLAAFYNVARQVVQPADDSVTPPIEEILEDDDRLRRRVQLAPESFTTAGSEGSYIFWALAASGQIKDVSVISPAPKEVVITVLSRDGDGDPTQELLDAVDAESQSRRPLTDLVVVQKPTIIPYQVHAVLTLYHGPDTEVVRQASESALRAYVENHHKLGHDITIAGLHAALWQEGVQNIDLTNFEADLIVPSSAAAFCTALTVHVGGRNV